MVRMVRIAAAVTLLMCLTSGCTPQWAGGLGLTRTTEGTLVAVIYSCTKQKVRISIQRPSLEFGTAPTPLFAMQAKIPKGMTTVPLTASPHESWLKVRFGAPVTAADAARRSLFVYVATIHGSLVVGQEDLRPGRLPTLDGQSKVTVRDGTAVVDSSTFERTSAETCRT
jgi:hypothetical protein